MSKQAIVLHTNVLVAAGLNPRSSSAWIVEEIRSRYLELLWNEPTRQEIRAVVERIPTPSWRQFAALFHEENRYEGKTSPGKIDYVPDPADRHFAALAMAAKPVLITNGEDLLGHRDPVGAYVMTPEAFVERRLV